MHSSSAKQRACPIRHSPKFYCCEYSGTTTVVYTKYNRPVGGDYESFYIDGWNKQRQVNYPYVMYDTQTPKFYYNDPSTICRVQAYSQAGNGPVDGRVTVCRLQFIIDSCVARQQALSCCVTTLWIRILRMLVYQRPRPRPRISPRTQRLR